MVEANELVNGGTIVLEIEEKIEINEKNSKEANKRSNLVKRK